MNSKLEMTTTEFQLHELRTDRFSLAPQITVTQLLFFLSIGLYEKRKLIAGLITHDAVKSRRMCAGWTLQAAHIVI